MSNLHMAKQYFNLPLVKLPVTIWMSPSKEEKKLYACMSCREKYCYPTNFPLLIFDSVQSRTRDQNLEPSH